MKLVLGGAQFGLNYGVTNLDGKVSQQSLSEILTLAQKSGIKQIDTAPAYGDCENLLGQYASPRFEYISKVSHCENPEQLEVSVLESLSKLRVPYLNGLLFHNESTLLAPSGETLLKRAHELKTAGLVKNIGVSFYTSNLVSQIVSHCDLDFVQCPVNLLDQRFIADSITSLLAKRHIKLHTRSVFLQGLLASSSLPIKFQIYSKYFEAINALASQLACTPLTLALAIVAQNNHVDKVLVGCCSAEQLTQVVHSYQLAEQLNIDINAVKELACTEETLINPTLWPI
ncbi:aldo/keto reductase [Pseudoalteromonas xiamenensis]